MSDDIDTIRTELWAKMRKKKYRENFVAAHISTNIAAQMQTIRESQQLTQKDLAERAEMSQARISVMEDPSYDKLTLSTLKRIASALDVALIVRFVPFSELVDWVSNLSPEKMLCPTFAQDSLNRPLVVLDDVSTKHPARLPNSPLVAAKANHAAAGSRYSNTGAVMRGLRYSPL